MHGTHRTCTGQLEPYNMSNRTPTNLETLESLLAEWEVGVCCGPNPACGAQVNREGCHIELGRLPAYPLDLSS